MGEDKARYASFLIMLFHFVHFVLFYTHLTIRVVLCLGLATPTSVNGSVTTGQAWGN
jgi:hypothetical protein